MVVIREVVFLYEWTQWAIFQDSFYLTSLRIGYKHWQLSVKSIDLNQFNSIALIDLIALIDGLTMALNGLHTVSTPLYSVSSIRLLDAEISFQL